MNEWISVKDKLPDLNKFCLAYKSTRGFSPTSAVVTQYTKYGFDSSCVTHWMPLPKPPTQ